MVINENTLRNLRCALRVCAALVVLGLPLGLFVGGAQPIAVGLIPAPYDKIAHAVVFALLAGAMGYVSALRGWSMLLVAGLGALAVGALDEWHQSFLPGRTAGWDDLAADAMGAALGALALLARERIKAWMLKHH